MAPLNLKGKRRQSGTSLEPAKTSGKKTAEEWDALHIDGLRIRSWSDFGRGLRDVLPSANTRTKLSRKQFLEARQGASVSPVPRGADAHRLKLKGKRKAKKKPATKAKKTKAKKTKVEKELAAAKKEIKKLKAQRAKMKQLLR